MRITSVAEKHTGPSPATSVEDPPKTRLSDAQGPPKLMFG
jgi:hypothetical protein